MRQTEGRPSNLKRRLREGGPIAIAALVGIGAIAVGGNDLWHRPAGARMAATAPFATEVQATDLFKAYEGDKAAFAHLYDDQALLVHATVAGVEFDKLHKPRILLHTLRRMKKVPAALTTLSQPIALGLSEGQDVTLLCDSLGDTGLMPMLEGCDIR